MNCVNLSRSVTKVKRCERSAFAIIILIIIIAITVITIKTTIIVTNKQINKQFDSFPSHRRILYLPLLFGDVDP